MEGLLGKKLGMTRLFDDKGVAVATTLIQAGPCWVTQIETNRRAGRQVVQMGFEETSRKRMTRGQLGHLQDLPPLGDGKTRRQTKRRAEKLPDLPVLRHLREVPVEAGAEVKIGDRFDAAIFAEGDLIDVTATSKGKGFAGVMKRHGFSGGPKTHGQSDRWRAPGSIGSGTTPGRVMKGMRMAGHMGNRRVTVKNLQVLRVDPEKNVVAVKGAVPGPSGGLVVIKKRFAT
jgi:large subunit ribosomal protein L3